MNPQQDSIQEQTTDDSSFSPLLKSLGIMGVVLLGLPATVYYTIPSVSIHGRQLNQMMTGYEFDSIKTNLKDKMSSNNISINDEFATEDVINKNCPHGFSVGEIKGGITRAQINNLIDGNCGI